MHKVVGPVLAPTLPACLALIICFLILPSPIPGAAAAAEDRDSASPLPLYQDVFSTHPEGFPADPDQPYGHSTLPPGRPFPSLPSDPRDLKIAFRKTDDARWEADVGGYRSLWGWKGDVKDKPLVLHAGIEGNAYFTMRQQGSRFPLESSDGLFGAYVEAVRGKWLFQLRYTHISAHLSDGSPDVTRAIRYSREFIVLRAAYQWAWVRPYFGLNYLTNTIPKGLPAPGLQAGFYAIPPLSWGRLHPYLGTDLRMRGGAEGSTLTLSAGAALASSLGAPLVRFGFQFMLGHDLRGQFFDKEIRKLSAGLELDF